MLQCYMLRRSWHNPILVPTPSCIFGSSESDQSSARYFSIRKQMETGYNPHRAIVTGDVPGFVKLSEDGLGQNFSEFDTHLV